MKLYRILKSRYPFSIQIVLWTILLVSKACFQSFGQSNSNNSEERYFIVVEQQPEFPGGPEARKKFIAEHLVAPKSAGKVTGRVFISFIVNTDGSRQDIALLKSLSPEHDKEALRVVKAMPKWNPGSQSGKTVRVKYVLPIEFR